MIEDVLDVAGLFFYFEERALGFEILYLLVEPLFEAEHFFEEMH
jgi:hypothetical protein